MKLGIVADTHFNGKDFALQLKGWRALLLSMKEEGVDWVVVAGDMFDRSSIGDKYVSTEALLFNIMTVIEEVNLPIIIIEGNHDWTGNPEQIRALSLFKDHRLIHPVLEPKVLNLDDPSYPVALFLFPWPWLSGKSGGKTSDYWKQMLHSFSRCKTEGYRRVFVGHIQVEGSHNAYGFVLPESITNITKQDLLLTGCENFFLGHIHNRQGYYIGTPWQLNHGESNNICGWELYDSVTGRSEFIEHDIGPRYYSVSLEEYESPSFNKEEGHHIKVLGDRAPIRLLPGDVSSKTTTKKEKVTRTKEETLDNSNIRRLFELWCKQKNIDGSSVINYIPEFITTKESNSPNNLLTINSITLENIGPHKNTHWDLEETGWFGIFGKVGSGKSIVLEAIMAALYGEFLHRGNLKRIATDDNARIKVVLTNKEAKFTWERICKKGHWSARVVKHIPGQEDDLLTVSDSQATKLAHEKIADKQTLLWSCFSAQSGFKDKEGKRDIISADKSKRMDFLRSFLGLELYDDLYKEFSIKHTEAKDKLDKLRDISAKLLEFRSAKQSVEENIKPILSKLKSVELNLKELKLSVQEKDLEQSKKLVLLNQELNTLTSERNKAESKYNSSRRDYEIKFMSLKKEYNNSLEAEEKLKLVPCLGMGDDGGCLPCHLIRDTEKIALNKSYNKKELTALKEVMESPTFLQNLSESIEKIKENIILKNKEISFLVDSSSEDNSIELEINNVQYEERKLLQTKGELEGRLQVINSHIEKMLEMLEELEEIESNEKNYKLLVEAFSREGISQLLIDQHLLEIQTILDDICENDFQNMFEIQLSTVGQHKSKDSEYETFAINCVKNGFTYPAEFCSGGELASIRIAFRVALIIYQATRNLGGLRVAFLDEPTAHQDDVYTECTLKMLERLKVNFNQVLVVSHDHSLMWLFNHKLLLG